MKPMVKLTAKEECLLLLNEFQQIKAAGAANYAFSFRPSAEEQQELESIYQRMDAWKRQEFSLLCQQVVEQECQSIEQALDEYIKFGYMPLLPKGVILWTTTQIS